MGSGRLTRKIDGKLDISLSGPRRGNVVGNQWLEILQTDMAYHFDLAVKVLKISINFNDYPPLCARFIDALSWYGDAVSESSYAAKIIKYVTAIERITGTGVEKDNEGKERSVTEIVIGRSSILYSVFTGETIAKSNEIVSKIYKLRSDLVHGSLSPFDESCSNSVHIAEEISRMVLLAGLDYFFQLDTDLSLNQKRLKEKYKELEVSAKL